MESLQWPFTGALGFWILHSAADTVNKSTLKAHQAAVEHDGKFPLLVVLFSSFLWGPECTQCLQPATFYRWVQNVPIAHRTQSQGSAQMLVFKWGEVSNSDAPIVKALSAYSYLPALSWALHCLAFFVFLGHSVVEAGCWEFTVAWWLLCVVETRFWAKRKVT